jgi:hypothetical protein
MLDPGYDEYTKSEVQKDLESRNQNLVPRIIYSQLNDGMRQGLFPKDDISKKDSTEFRRDLDFEGLRPKTYGRMHSLPKKCCPLNPQS